MTADPAEAVGLVVIRVWVEPAPAHARDDGLRARITTAADRDLNIEETFTVAGIDGVLTIVRDFLAARAAGRPSRPPARPVCRLREPRGSVRTAPAASRPPPGRAPAPPTGARYAGALVRGVVGTRSPAPAPGGGVGLVAR